MILPPWRRGSSCGRHSEPGCIIYKGIYVYTYTYTYIYIYVYAYIYIYISIQAYIRKQIQSLALHVHGAHVHDALEAEQGAGRGGGDAVLPGAGLRDDALLAEVLGEQRLAERVVDLVRAGVGQLLALEPELRAAELLGHVLGLSGSRVRLSFSNGLRVATAPRCKRTRLDVSQNLVTSCQLLATTYWYSIV